MPEEKEKKEEKAPQTKRMLFLERMRKKRPDIADDDETLFGAIGEDYDGYEKDLSGYKENADRLISAFNKDPRIAQFIMKLTYNENPLGYLIETFGQDELRSALDDPEMAKKLVEKNENYLAKVAKDKELSEQRQENLKESLDALDEVAKEFNLTEEETDALFDTFLTILDNAIMNKISKDDWTMFFKGSRYDDAIASASEEAEKRGRNAKIEELKSKTKLPKDMPPTLGGQDSGVGRKKIKLGGVLDRDRKSVWDEK